MMKQTLFALTFVVCPLFAEAAGTAPSAREKTATAAAANPHLTLVKRMTNEEFRAATVLVSVKDKETADAAAVLFREAMSNRVSLAKQRQSLPEPSEAQQEELHSFYRAQIHQGPPSLVIANTLGFLSYVNYYGSEKLRNTVKTVCGTGWEQQSVSLAMYLKGSNYDGHPTTAENSGTGDNNPHLRYTKEMYNEHQSILKILKTVKDSKTADEAAPRIKDILSCNILLMMADEASGAPTEAQKKEVDSFISKQHTNFPVEREIISIIDSIIDAKFYGSDSLEASLISLLKFTPIPQKKS